MLSVINAASSKGAHKHRNSEIFVTVSGLRLLDIEDIAGSISCMSCRYRPAGPVTACTFTLGGISEFYRIRDPKSSEYRFRDLPRLPRYQVSPAVRLGTAPKVADIHSPAEAFRYLFERDLFFRRIMQDAIILEHKCFTKYQINLVQHVHHVTLHRFVKCS
jgi:hypothetical protein